MKKYKIIIQEQSFILETKVDLKEKLISLIGEGLIFLETESFEETPKEEEMLKESVQKIKPVIIDSKVLKMARPGVRRRQKYPEEMIYYVKQNMNEMSNEELAKAVNQNFDLKITPGRLACYLNNNHLKRENPNRQRVERKKKGKKKKTSQKYPPEMKEFIEDNMNEMGNIKLCEAIKNKFGVDITPPRLANYMFMRELKRGNPNRKRWEGRVGKPKKYTDEVVQFLRDNINNFSNKELCGELENRFKIKTTKVSLQAQLSLKGIKRDFQPGAEQEIVDFIMKNKTDEIYKLKDKIIIKFEKDLSIPELRKILNHKNLPGESPADEVKRIKQQRETFEPDEDVDDLELD